MTTRSCATQDTPSAAGSTPLSATFAPIALAEREQVALHLAFHPGQALQALVLPVKREVEPGIADIAEAGVVLLHHRHASRARGAATRSGRSSARFASLTLCPRSHCGGPCPV